MKNHLRSPFLLLVLALLVFGLVFIAYRLFMNKSPEQKYRLAEITQGDLRQTVSANGTINPLSLVNVCTQVSGTVKKLHVDFNSKVEKGQVLLELDDALLSAQLKQSQANLASATASAELAAANEARIRSLYAQEYVSRQELDTSVQAKKAAEAQLQLTRAAVEKDRANLSYSVIRSPVSGVVVNRTIDVGQTVAASLQAPTLFQIAQDLKRMQIHANFAEADIGSIRAGQLAQFTVDAFASRNFQGKVHQIRLNPITQQNVVTYDVVIDVENPEQILMPGMTAYVTIAVAERKNVLLVPNAALRYKPADTTPQLNGASPKKENKARRDGYSGRIFRLQDGKPMALEVSLGISDNRNTEITAGEVKAGDKILVGETQESASQSGSAGPRMRMF